MTEGTYADVDAGEGDGRKVHSVVSCDAAAVAAAITTF